MIQVNHLNCVELGINDAFNEGQIVQALEKINHLSEIYQPVSLDDLNYVEQCLEFQFPDRLRRIFQEPDIESIQKLPTLLWVVEHPSLGILETNNALHHREIDPFPEYLIAFATNECGDWFCFDKKVGDIIYIDPDETLEENLQGWQLVYPSLEVWMERHNAAR